MKLLITTCIITTFFTPAIVAEEKDNSQLFQDILISSKWAGMCGAFKQMLAFQESTKMPGGGEFITRFLATEQARLNISQQQLFDACEKATSTYDLYNSLSQELKNEINN